jgi:nucleoside-diphosphate-sugar epimerase
VLFKLALCKLHGETFHIHELFGMKRDYIHLTSVISKIAQIAENIHVIDRIHPVGNGVGVDVMPMLESLCKEFNIQYDYIQPPPEIGVGYIMPVERNQILEKEIFFSDIFNDYLTILS